MQNNIHLIIRIREEKQSTLYLRETFDIGISRKQSTPYLRESIRQRNQLCQEGT